MYKALVFLLCLAACTKPAAPPPAHRGMGAAPPTASADTLYWVDTVTSNDTTFFTKGHSITSTVTVTDSQWNLVMAIKFGLFNTWNGSKLQPKADVFTMTYGGENVGTLGARLAYAAAHNVYMVTAMTGGARSNYQGSDGKFSLALWKAKMRTFGDDSTKLLARNGRLLANSVMDEPFNDGGPGNEDNAWNFPIGTNIIATVDTMCTVARRVLHSDGYPDIPQGVFQDWNLGPDSAGYKSCEFITSQYRYAKGPLASYLAGAQAKANKWGMALSFAINTEDGGIPASRKRPDGTIKVRYEAGDCPSGRGTYFPNCRMTPAQIRESGWTLGSAGCFLTGFRYDAETMQDTAYVNAFKAVSDSLAKLPRRSCKRA